MLTEFLANQLAALPDHQRLLVAFSGGPDSSALLHALSEIQSGVPVIAIHVDHQLDPESGARAHAAAGFAARLGVECRNLTVSVHNDGDGLEAAARQARYGCLEAEMQPGDVLLTAHHADDQAETILLKLLRASGPVALAGMRRIRRFGPGWLARPMLTCTRAELLDYLAARGIEPLQDPSNLDTAHDRNFLRHRVLPLMAERWPTYRDAVLKAAKLFAEAGDAQETLAGLDLAGVSDGPEKLDTRKLLQLPEARQRALLRHWCNTRNIPPPPARRLATLIEQLPAPPDRHPEIRWDAWALRRQGQWLHLLVE